MNKHCVDAPNLIRPEGTRCLGGNFTGSRNTQERDRRKQRKDFMARSSRRPINRFVRLAFWLSSIGIGSALCYAAALACFPLLAIYALPIQNLDKLTGANGRIGLGLAVGVLALFAGYGAGALVIWKAQRSPSTTQNSKLKTQNFLPVALLGFPLIFLALLIF